MRRSRPTKKISQQLEIEYKFHPKTAVPGYERIHWMYVVVEGADHDDCKEKAKAHFTKQMRELGWTKITTLVGIAPLRHGNDPSPRKANNELSGARTKEEPKKGAKRKPSTRKSRKR